MTGRNVPSNSSCAAACSSAKRPMYEPSSESWRANRCRRSMRGVGAGRRAAGHQAPAGGERAHAAVPGRLADVFDDDVDAAAVGEAPRPPRRNRPRSDRSTCVGAERPRAIELLLAPAVANTRAPKMARDLDRGLPDAAAAGQHQHDVSPARSRRACRSACARR